MTPGSAGGFHVVWEAGHDGPTERDRGGSMIKTASRGSGEWGTIFAGPVRARSAIGPFNALVTSDARDLGTSNSRDRVTSDARDLLTSDARDRVIE